MHLPLECASRRPAITSRLTICEGANVFANAQVSCMLFQLPTLLSIAHATIVILISVRVIMRRPANGIALAWLFLVAVLPFAGAMIYLLVGERRVGLRRARRIACAP